MSGLRSIPNLIRHRALLALAYLWRKLMFRTRFIAITGSVGKTTTKEFVNALLANLPAATIANFATENTISEVAATLLRVRPWHRFAVLEVATGRPGHLAVSARLVAPEIAVVLAVARTHTNNFRTLEETAAEKASLLRFVRPGGVAILNADDARVAAMRPRRRVRVVYFGSGETADLQASGIRGDWPERLSFFVTHKTGRAEMRSQLVGTHWTAAALAAVAVALECGMRMDEIAAALPRIPPAAGRMEPRTLPNGAVILRDEFNGSLDTFHAAFAALRAAEAKRKILLITTVTDSTESWDRRLRRIAVDAAQVVDVLALIGSRDDSRRAAKAAVAAGLAADRLWLFPDLRDAAGYLRHELRQGDLLLLRGKGEHHLTRLFYAQLGEVACWKATCPKRILCDHCAELLPAKASG